MGIGGIRAMESQTVRQPAANQQVDSISKNIENEISDAQRQKQGLSSKADIPVEEKIKKRQELQQEISSLNAQLRQHQAEVRREQQKEALSAEKRAEELSIRNKDDHEPGIKANTSENSEAEEPRTKKTGPENAETKPEVKDVRMSKTEMHALISADSSIKKAKTQNAVITRMEDGIVTLKGEIRQDKARGENVDKKEAELAKQEAKLQKVSASQFTALDKANETMRAAAQVKLDETRGTKGAHAYPPKNNNDKIIINAANFSID